MIQIRGLSKSYDGVNALSDVNLDLAPAEIHAVCGENGAGKSTLIKILSGIVQPDAGHITVNGTRLITGRVHASEAAGIAVMHQESAAFPHLNAVENLFVGREITRCRGLFLNHAAMKLQTENAAAETWRVAGPERSGRRTATGSAADGCPGSRAVTGLSSADHG